MQHFFKTLSFKTPIKMLCNLSLIILPVPTSLTTTTTNDADKTTTTKMTNNNGTKKKHQQLQQAELEIHQRQHKIHQQRQQKSSAFFWQANKNIFHRAAVKKNIRTGR